MIQVDKAAASRRFRSLAPKGIHAEGEPYGFYVKRIPQLTKVLRKLKREKTGAMLHLVLIGRRNRELIGKPGVSFLTSENADAFIRSLVDDGLATDLTPIARVKHYVRGGQISIPSEMQALKEPSMLGSAGGLVRRDVASIKGGRSAIMHVVLRDLIASVLAKHPEYKRSEITYALSGGFEAPHSADLALAGFQRRIKKWRFEGGKP